MTLVAQHDGQEGGLHSGSSGRGIRSFWSCGVHGCHPQHGETADSSTPRAQLETASPESTTRPREGSYGELTEEFQKQGENKS